MTAEYPVKVYKRISRQKGKPAADSHISCLVKFQVFLRDRPGSLADFASLIAACSGNISFFHYDRSIDSNRVVVEIQMSGQKDIQNLVSAVAAKQYTFDKKGGQRDEIRITAQENVLEIKARLENRPGTLASFAQLFKKHHANVIYLFYDEDIDKESANIALAAKNSGEIDNLLHAINKKGYHYRVVYRGSDRKEIDHIIGLNLIEKFFISLRRLLTDSELDEVKAIVKSSQGLTGDLVKFYSEAGNNLEAIDVFEQVLTLASLARNKTGGNFSAGEMPPLDLGDNVRLFGFRLPTSENVYVFRHGNELTMIDTGYGVYYKDFRKLLESKSLDPASVRRIFVTHADADHAGMTGYFAHDYGTEVFMHPGSRHVIKHNNRSYGTPGKLSNLNKYYTRLVNRFTECRFPEKLRCFSTSAAGNAGDFPVTDTFKIGNLLFEVIESLGGHIPGNVFFLNREHGLLFTADYLLNIGSLSATDKQTLNVYKYLLVSPNSNSEVFRDEMKALKSLLADLNANLKKAGRTAIVFPGHGEYYPFK
jgi:glyoxylase-like metal-dependent hydrolase (beta-lactamase superfamily II)/uncharacterized protein with ACT and thioredoxin-like domain